jgi:hypothetical protein
MTADGARPNLNILDKLRMEVEARNPGWHIWYVPTSLGPVSWCARPLPGLVCGSPEELEQAIAEVRLEVFPPP